MPAPTVPLPKQCLAFSLRKAMRSFSQIYDDALRPADLKASQYNVLVAVTRLGPVAQKDLAMALGMDKTTLTRNLAPLERRGLIESISGADRRVRRISMTASGLALMETVYPLWRDAQNGIAQRLGPETMDALIESLGAATNGLSSPE